MYYEYTCELISIIPLLPKDKLRKFRNSNHPVHVTESPFELQGFVWTKSPLIETRSTWNKVQRQCVWSTFRETRF